MTWRAPEAGVLLRPGPAHTVRQGARDPRECLGWGGPSEELSPAGRAERASQPAGHFPGMEERD